MSSHLAILILFLSSSALLLSASRSFDDTVTPYKILKDYHFPPGLLPEGVRALELDNSTGEFTVYLNDSCSFYSADSYEFRFASTITGLIAKNKLTGLTGVETKVLFFWLSIADVVRYGDELEFSVGIASIDFPVSTFDESPTCGGGFDGRTLRGKQEKIKNSNNSTEATTKWKIAAGVAAGSLSQPTTLALSQLLVTFLQYPPPASSFSVYQVLDEFNFPKGLLPKTVIGYKLDRGSGRFHAFLNNSCIFSIYGSYHIEYKPTIGGYITSNRITDLTGIRVKVLFFWLNIVEVIRVGDELEFSVGITSVSFPIDSSLEFPPCGCGL